MKERHWYDPISYLSTSVFAITEKHTANTTRTPARQRLTLIMGRIWLQSHYAARLAWCLCKHYASDRDVDFFSFLKKDDKITPLPRKNCESGLAPQSCNINIQWLVLVKYIPSSVAVPAIAMENWMNSVPQNSQSDRQAIMAKFQTPEQRRRRKPWSFYEKRKRLKLTKCWRLSYNWHWQQYAITWSFSNTGRERIRPHG